MKDWDGSVVIEGQYDEIDEQGDQLDLSDNDSLPWLEADEEDQAAGGVDTAQLVGFVGVLLAILAGVVGAIWYFSSQNQAESVMADGSTIEAPADPYKERPSEDERGGREVEGTGNVAPAVAEGQMTEGRIASETGAAAGDQNLSIEMPPIGGATPLAGGTKPVPAKNEKAPEAPAPKPQPAEKPAAAAAGANTDPATPNVQLAAYSSRARAEQGWREISGRTSALQGIKYRVIEGRADIGTVFRLQALPGDRAAANQLCRTLKAQGIECQVKP
ncbi:MAG: SPOR domain-containing protein [Erythrobacter sp.]|jgi:hypothetical protein|nr:SPOR domain-containing protein [Erythrobacter sp.]